MQFSEMTRLTNALNVAREQNERYWQVDNSRYLHLRLDGHLTPQITIYAIDIRQDEPTPAVFVPRLCVLDFTPEDLEVIAAYIRTVKEWKSGARKELPASTIAARDCGRDFGADTEWSI